MAVYTVGHSNVPFERLLATLESASVGHVVDVRRIPSSRRHPQFNRSRLDASLAEHRIRYTHAAALGGRRPARPDSINQALGPEWSRGYADHMATPEFRQALADLIVLSLKERVAILCAEGNPDDCHRSLIADALALAKVEVVHLIGPGETRPHVPHPALRPGPDGEPTYPDAPRLFR